MNLWHVGLLVLISACAALPPRGEAVADFAVEPPPWVWRVDADATEVELRAVVVAGSARDPSGREGLAALSAAVVRVDADVTVEVGRDLVEIGLRCPAVDRVACGQRFIAALSVVPDESARAAGIAWLAEAPPNPTQWLWRSVYEGHPYGQVPAGRAEIWPLLTVDEVTTFRARWWTRMQTQLGAYGAWTAEEQRALEDASRALSSWPVPDHPLMRPVPVRQTRLLRVVTGEAGSTTTAHAGLALGTPIEPGEAVALALGLAALGPLGGEGGWLPGSYPLAGVAPLSAEPTLRHPMVALEHWVATPDALSERLAALGGAVLGEQSVARVNAARAAWLAELNGMEEATPSALIASLRARSLGVDPVALKGHLEGVSVAGVERALRIHLVPERLHVVVVGPQAADWHLPPRTDGLAVDERTLTLP